MRAYMLFRLWARSREHFKTRSSLHLVSQGSEVAGSYEKGPVMMRPAPIDRGSTGIRKQADFVHVT